MKKMSMMNTTSIIKVMSMVTCSSSVCPRWIRVLYIGVSSVSGCASSVSSISRSRVSEARRTLKRLPRCGRILNTNPDSAVTSPAMVGMVAMDTP